MKKYLIALLLLCFAMDSISAKNPIYDIDSVTFGIGKSKKGAKIFRIGLIKNFEHRWNESSNGYFSGYYELSSNILDIKGKNYVSIALSPVLAIYIKNKNFMPYFVLGIGGSLWSSTHIGNKNISTHFQFEDRIGMGIKMKNFNFEIKYIHYSNAGIKDPNPGIDTFFTSITYKF